MSGILLPIAVVGGIGLLFGCLLAFAAVVFKVEKDDRIERIEEILPGANVFCIMNTDLKAEVTSGYAKICGHYQVPFLQLNGLDKKTFHPTILGMQQIARQVDQALNEL